jgi:hypothetical protein
MRTLAKRVPKLTEAQVTRQCNDWLRCHGWDPRRQQSGLVARPNGGRFRIGEPGLPDYVVLRATAPGEAECFWLEYKASRQKPTVHQEIYHEQLRNAGYLVCVADGVDALAAWVGINFPEVQG